MLCPFEPGQRWLRDVILPVLIDQGHVDDIAYRRAAALVQAAQFPQKWIFTISDPAEKPGRERFPGDAVVWRAQINRLA